MANALKQEKIVFQISITGYEDGQMEVNGPSNPIVFIDIMNQAQRLMLDRYHKHVNESKNSTEKTKINGV
jgi:hypothetical protein